MSIRRIVRAVPERTVFMECDVQDKFRKHIFKFDQLAHNAKRLAQFSKIMNIPLIATQQQKMGPIAPEVLAEHPDDVFLQEKASFSMLNDPVSAHLESLNKTNVVLYGLEAHVCMRQTAFDLLERDMDVHLVVDACSSMGHHDRNVGISSM